MKCLLPTPLTQRSRHSVTCVTPTNCTSTHRIAPDYSPFPVRTPSSPVHGRRARVPPELQDTPEVRRSKKDFRHDRHLSLTGLPSSPSRSVSSGPTSPRRRRLARTSGTGLAEGPETSRSGRDGRGPSTTKPRRSLLRSGLGIGLYSPQVRSLGDGTEGVVAGDSWGTRS